MGCELHIIEPAGFRTDDTALKRAGMDYGELATVTRHDDFIAFQDWRNKNAKRLILLTTKTTHDYTSFAFAPSDILLLGRESSGVPETVHQTCDHRITIKMQGEARSLNQAVCAAMVLGEALRQTGS